MFLEGLPSQKVVGSLKIRCFCLKNLISEICFQEPSSEAAGGLSFHRELAEGSKKRSLREGGQSVELVEFFSQFFH